MSIHFGDPGAEGLSQLSDCAVSTSQPALRTAEEMISISQLDDTAAAVALPEAPATTRALQDACVRQLSPASFTDGHAEAAARDDKGEALPRLARAAHDSAGRASDTRTSKHSSREPKGSSTKRKATRGPMDEMRQLVRILNKMLPESMRYVALGDAGEGGGNRISEEQIKCYLKNTLGDAVAPTWGVQGGWCKYLSELFEWATGEAVHCDDVRKCFKRDAGRPWEAVWPSLYELGLYTNKWPLPLTQAGIAAAQASAKRNTDVEKNELSYTISKRGRSAPSSLPSAGAAAASKKRRVETPPLNVLAAAEPSSKSLRQLWELVDKHLTDIMLRPDDPNDAGLGFIKRRVACNVQALVDTAAPVGKGDPGIGVSASEMLAELSAPKQRDVWCTRDGGEDVVCIRKACLDGPARAAAAPPNDAAAVGNGCRAGAASSQPDLLRQVAAMSAQLLSDAAAIQELLSTHGVTAGAATQAHPPGIAGVPQYAAALHTPLMLQPGARGASTCPDVVTNTHAPAAGHLAQQAQQSHATAASHVSSTAPWNGGLPPAAPDGTTPSSAHACTILSPPFHGPRPESDVVVPPGMRARAAGGSRGEPRFGELDVAADGLNIVSSGAAPKSAAPAAKEHEKESTVFDGAMPESQSLGSQWEVGGTQELDLNVALMSQDTRGFRDVLMLGSQQSLS